MILPRNINIATVNKQAGLRNTASADWNHFAFIDLFAGIGGIRLGFECMGGTRVFSSEIFFLFQSTSAL